MFLSRKLHLTVFPMFLKYLPTLFFTTFIFFPLASAFQSLVVETPTGKINGKIVYHNGIAVRAYLGIPYANAPVGHLRFKKPVPVEPWVDTLQAKSFGPGCIQNQIQTDITTDTMPGLSENCLSLNIWVPILANRRNKKTVMFFIHTGGFDHSSSRVDFVHGQVLAAVGDVIVVTMNYRLGAEGFFYSGTEDAPGNAGAWDIVEAFKWVRRNIESFGGNIDSITVFGHSAGSIVAGMFSVSPVTRGLFKRLILQSGPPTNLYGDYNYRDGEVSQELAKKAKCATDEDSLSKNPKAVVDCMRERNPFELVKLLQNVSAVVRYRFYPRYGDELFPQNSRQAIIDGDFEPVDLLIGNNNGAGTPLLTSFKPEVFGKYGEKNPQINRSFGDSLIREYFKMNFVDPEPVIRQYLDGLEEDDYYKIRYKVAEAFGDYARICPSNYMAETTAKKNPVVYYYHFTHRPSNTPFAPWMLAVHFVEVPFVFGYPLRYPQCYTSDELDLSRRMVMAWTNFAKTGNPGVGAWPLYSKERPIFQVLDVFDPNVIGFGPHQDNCDFFRPKFGF